MTGVVISVVAALVTLAVVLLLLRLPRITGESADERLAAISLDIRARMEERQRELEEALRRAQGETGSPQPSGDTPGALELKTLLRRTAEAASALTGGDAAVIEATALDGHSIDVEHGLSADEREALALGQAPDDSEPDYLILSYRYSDVARALETSALRTGLTVPIRGSAGRLGSLTVLTRDGERRFTEVDALDLRELAARAGRSIESAGQGLGRGIDAERAR